MRTHNKQTQGRRGRDKKSVVVVLEPKCDAFWLEIRHENLLPVASYQDQ